MSAVAAARASRPRWLTRLQGYDPARAEQGRLFAPSEANACLVLRHHHDWRGVLGHDERAGSDVFLKEAPFLSELAGDRRVPRPVSDADATRCAAWCERVFGVTIGSERWHRALSVVAQEHRFDRFRDRLDALRWDGRPRLDTWLVDYLGADDGVFVRAVGQRFLIALVARTYRPGCKSDHVLVLEGPQGIGKSSALRALVGDEWFADNPPDISRDSKDARSYIRGPVLVEWAELASWSRAEAAAIKSFVTTQVDRFRPPYGRREIEVPRRCVFAATTNEDSYLKDQSGNRRFWPVRCHPNPETGLVDYRGIARDCDQLLAEAVHRFRAGEPWHFDDPALLAAARDAQDDRREVDPLEVPVGRFAVGKDELTTAEILDALGYERPTRSDEMRVGTILRGLGYQRHRRRVGGRRTVVYLSEAGRDGGSAVHGCE